MKLIGSKPSPYVRRLRLWLEGVDYEFVDLDIYGQPGREILETYNPAMKVPMLLDGEQPVYDSRVIFRYLSEKLGRNRLSWSQENQLTLVDATLDSLIVHIMASRSGMDFTDDRLIFNLQRDRLDRTLPLLSQMVEAGEFAEWEYPAICLFSLLDWADFRALLELGSYPALEAFHAQQLHREIVQATDPRN